MTKAVVDELISNMRKAGIVTKATPWMIEGMDAKQNPDKVGMNIRYVGIRATEDWDSIFSDTDNLLIKFIIDRSTSSFEFYLANKPPFLKITSRYFSAGDKWEILLGEIRRKLRKDFADYKSNSAGIGNWYTILKPHLKHG